MSAFADRFPFGPTDDGQGASAAPSPASDAGVTQETDWSLPMPRPSDAGTTAGNDGSRVGDLRPFAGEGESEGLFAADGLPRNGTTSQAGVTLVSGQGVQVSGIPEALATSGEPETDRAKAPGWVVDRHVQGRPSAAGLASRLATHIPLLALAIFLAAVACTYPLARALLTRGTDPLLEGSSQGLYYHRERFMYCQCSVTGEQQDEWPYFRAADFLFVHNAGGTPLVVAWADETGSTSPESAFIDTLDPGDDGILGGFSAGNDETDLAMNPVDPRACLRIRSTGKGISLAASLTWHEASRASDLVTLNLTGSLADEEGSAFDPSQATNLAMVSQTHVVILDGLTWDESHSGSTITYRIAIPQASRYFVFDDEGGYDLYVGGVRIPSA